MIEEILKYKFYTLAILMAVTSLSIWYYILSIADYRSYPPLAILYNFDRVPVWILGLHYFTGALSLLFSGLSAFKGEVYRWIIGLIL